MKPLLNNLFIDKDAIFRQLGLPLPKQDDKTIFAAQDHLLLLLAYKANTTNSKSRLQQMTSVDEIAILQQLISARNHVADTNHTLQASVLVGREIQYITPNEYYMFDNELEGTVVLTEFTQNITVRIEYNNTILTEIYLDDHVAGLRDYKWDCLSDEGINYGVGPYKISAYGYINQRKTPLTTTVKGQVSSVAIEAEAKSIILNLGKQGKIAIADVVKLY